MVYALLFLFLSVGAGAGEEDLVHAVVWPAVCARSSSLLFFSAVFSSTRGASFQDCCRCRCRLSCPTAGGD